MANKKVSQLTSKPSVLVTDLFPIADPSTGQLYKTTISDLGTAIGSGVSSVNGLVGAVVLDTDDIQELVSPTNKWFTDTRARAALSASSPLAYNSGTGVFSIPAATSSQNGYLTSTDWTTFNGKQAALSGTGFVKISGTTISYDNTSYLPLTGGTVTGGVTFSSTTAHTGTATFGVGSPTAIDGSDGRIITNKFRLYNTTPATIYSDFVTSATSNRTITIPDASGTMALTSDLSSYLPLSGGTLTGALSGTSATFSSFAQASNFDSNGSQFYSYILKGRASDNYGAIGFYSNNGATRYGYIQSGSIYGGQINITGDGGSYITLDNRGITASGVATFSSSVSGTQFNSANSNASGPAFAVSSGNGMYNVGTNAIGFSTNSSPRLIIDASGNVGIGTTSPATTLEILGINEGEYFRAGGGTISGRSLVFSNYSIGGTVGIGHRINAQNSGGELSFAIGGTERMRITSGGTLINESGIYDTGTSSLWYARQGGNNRIIADGNGYVYMPFLTTGSGIDDLGWWSGSGSSYVSGGMLMRISSSQRYKKNIRDLELDTNKVFDLRTISYENNELTATDGLTSFGLLAEDVAEKIPMLATYNEEGQAEGVQYKMLAVLLLEEMKKMKVQIEELKNK